jgi:hypothetical protein
VLSTALDRTNESIDGALQVGANEGIIVRQH